MCPGYPGKHSRISEEPISLRLCRSKVEDPVFFYPGLRLASSLLFWTLSWWLFCRSSQIIDYDWIPKKIKKFTEKLGKELASRVLFHIVHLLHMALPLKFIMNSKVRKTIKTGLRSTFEKMGWLLQESTQFAKAHLRQFAPYRNLRAAALKLWKISKSAQKVFRFLDKFGGLNTLKSNYLVIFLTFRWKLITLC